MAVLAVVGMCWTTLAGCGETNCVCSSAGDQLFELNEARLDGEILFLSVRVTGSPCCEDRWAEDVIYRVDLSDYTPAGGDVVGALSTTATGTAISVGPDLELEVVDLDLILRRNPNLTTVSVSAETAQLWQISSNTDNTVLGLITVPCGSEIR